MRVIETSYSGYKFRSRTEARYAVFFDALGEKWEYEKEGYDLDGEWYLPDFWLPTIEMFIEIKGVMPTDAEIRKCRKLQYHTERDVAIFWGTPLDNMGIAFKWSNDNGGTFTETIVQWTFSDGILGLSEQWNDEPEIIKASVAAKSARFEYPNSRPQRNVVDYERIPF